MGRHWRHGDPQDRPHPEEEPDPPCCGEGVEEIRDEDGELQKAKCATCGNAIWIRPPTEEEIRERSEAYNRALREQYADGTD